MNLPRLGVAAIKIEISDAKGFIVRHGSDESVILAEIPAENCAEGDWDVLWATINTLVQIRGGTRYLD